MKVSMSNTIAHLEGDFTVSGITPGNIDKLIGSLPQMKGDGDRSIQIDCRRISAIDSIGVDLLKEWVNLIKLRNFEPELVNLPENLRRYFKGTGLRYNCKSQSTPFRRDGISLNRKVR